MLQVHWLLERLAQVQALGSRQELFNRHTKEVISGLQSGYILWTQHSVERLVFDTLLLESGESGFIVIVHLSIEYEFHVRKV